jgi:hypothetical protein
MTAGLLSCAAFSATFAAPFSAAAQSLSYECSLSGNYDSRSTLAGCVTDTTGGFETSTNAVEGNKVYPQYCDSAHPYFCGAQTNLGLAIEPIEAWGTCRWVDNTSSTKFFVPFGRDTEWIGNGTNQGFLTAAQAGTLPGIGATHCAVPYSDTINGNNTPATVTIMPPFAGCTSISVNTPNVFGRTNTSLYPYPAAAGPGFTCHDGATSMTSDVQWKAGDSEKQQVIAGSTPSVTSSWNNALLYSPDMTLSAVPPSGYTGTLVTLTWTITPFVASDTMTCSVSPGGWGPDGTGAPNSGASVIPVDGVGLHQFVLSCTDNVTSLQSIATANVTIISPPPPPPPPGGGGGGGGGGCFAAGSQVLMADGRFKPIEILQFGDRVRGAHGRNNMVLRREICALPKDSDLYGFNGGKPMVTARHPFVTAQGYAAIDPQSLREKYPYFEEDIGVISSLEVGVVLVSIEGPCTIQSVQKYVTPEDSTAYDLVLDGDQTFFVEGFAVRTQQDNAHVIRSLPHLNKVSMRRAAAVSSVFASLGVAMSPMAALAGGGSSPSTAAAAGAE